MKYIFSILRNGLGLFITIFGIILLLLYFQCNLHSLREEPASMYSKIFRYVPSKFLVFHIFLTFILGLSSFLSFRQSPNIDYFIHVKSIITVIFVSIIIPKYYINQNPNLKLYVSVYHHQPAPVLPWQLPKDFDPNSVKLICVSYNNE